MSRRPQGAMIITDPSLGRPLESDSFTCVHCQRVTWTHDPTTGLRNPDPGGFCMNCFAQVCSKCAGQECQPFVKKMEQYERDVAQRGQLFRALR